MSDNIQNLKSDFFQTKDGTMKYTCIWFDLGHTLIKPTISIRYREVLAGLRIEKELKEVERAFYLANKTFMRDYPHILETGPEYHMPWYLGVVNYHLGVQVPLEKACSLLVKSGRVSQKYWELMDGAMETLKSIRSIGYRAGLISNWNSTCRSVLRESRLEPVLDTVIFSSEVGSGKPEPEIFEAAFKMAGVRPEQCLHVGDNYYDDIIGARRVGMDCLLIDPYCETVPEDRKGVPVIASVKEVFNYLE